MKIAARIVFALGVVWILGLILWNAYGGRSPTTGTAGVAVITSGTAQRHYFQVSSSESGLRIVPLGLSKEALPVQGLSGTARLATKAGEKPLEIPLRVLPGDGPAGGVLEALFDLKGVAKAMIAVEVVGFSDPAEPKAGFTLAYEGTTAKTGENGPR